VLLAKPEYSENSGISETFFPDSFLKLNSLKAHVKKNQKIDYVDTSFSEA